MQRKIDKKNYKICPEAFDKFFILNILILEQAKRVFKRGGQFDLLLQFKMTKEIVQPMKKSFKCSVCLLAFQSKSNLKQHIQGVHENVRPFICSTYNSCQMCSSAFAYKSTLQRHIKTVHEMNNNFVCQICSSAFGYRSNLQCHIKTVDKNERP